MTKPITLTATTFSEILAASRNEAAAGRTHVALYSNGAVRWIGSRDDCEATGQRTYAIADLIARVVL